MVGSIEAKGILLGGEVGTLDVIIIEFGATVVIELSFVGSSSSITGSTISSPGGSMTVDIGQQVNSASFNAAHAVLDAS